MPELKFMCMNNKRSLKIDKLEVVSPSGNLIAHFYCKENGNPLKRIITQEKMRQIAVDNKDMIIINLCGHGCANEDEE